jgi:hypothetical protein
METDYRKLCLDLFGTDDKEQLRKIAENVITPAIKDFQIA